MSEELKPCPLCGGKAELEIHKFGNSMNDYAIVYCKKCGIKVEAKINVEYSAKEKVIETWNRRTDNAKI